jgi:hypothetical protein
MRAALLLTDTTFVAEAAAEGCRLDVLAARVTRFVLHDRNTYAAPPGGFITVERAARPEAPDGRLRAVRVGLVYCSNVLEALGVLDDEAGRVQYNLEKGLLSVLVPVVAAPDVSVVVAALTLHAPERLRSVHLLGGVMNGDTSVHTLLCALRAAAEAQPPGHAGVVYGSIVQHRPQFHYAVKHAAAALVAAAHPAGSCVSVFLPLNPRNASWPGASAPLTAAAPIHDLKAREMLVVRFEVRAQGSLPLPALPVTRTGPNNFTVYAKYDSMGGAYGGSTQSAPSELVSRPLGGGPGSLPQAYPMECGARAAASCPVVRAPPPPPPSQPPPALPLATPPPRRQAPC